MEQQVKDEKHAGKLQVELTFGLKLLKFTFGLKSKESNLQEKNSRIQLYEERHS